ncbi:PepSY domain-containing protein [Halorussus salinisoli]|uniref:PepSY domain-containing protein n=1 Tax=Halorussus salinisoli TaxID=2558242 RepID=UPI0010C20377|nr:hypothetical protein [Halorussus salinisoli]
MNTFTIARPTVVAVGIGILLVVGAVGGGAVGVEALDAEQNSTVKQTTAATAGGAVAVQNESDGNDSTVPPNQTVEAMRAVENRTNGTVVGARLRGEEDAELEAAVFVYELDVLTANGTSLVAEVYAGNATVIGVEEANESDGVLGDLFESDDGVPDEARNASSLRSATEAVRLAVNETEAERANQTVTAVELGTRDDAPVYTVTLFESGGEPREIVVSAERGADDDIVTTDPESRGN